MPLPEWFRRKALDVEVHLDPLPLRKKAKIGEEIVRDLLDDLVVYYRTAAWEHGEPGRGWRDLDSVKAAMKVLGSYKPPVSADPGDPDDGPEVGL
jgi:hypothetical protein